MMNEKKLKILVIVPPERTDFYKYLDVKHDLEFYILWYVKESQFKPFNTPAFIKGYYYWSDYSTPASLLNSIKPDRIIFFEIIDLRQIALIVSARSKKIRTFYLEHGAAGDKDTAVSRWDEITFRKNKIPYLIKRFRTSFGDVISSKFFYYSVFKGFRSIRSYLTYLALPVKMLFEAPNKVLTHNLFRERVPDYSIVFNEANFEEFALYTGIGIKDALLTGVPFFDKYYSSNHVEKEHVIYLDHPYLEENIVGWTPDHHKKIVRIVSDFAAKNKVKVYVKLHPRSNASLWNSNELNEFVEVLQFGDYTELFLSSKLILGYSSSLITAFLCARKNVVLLGWHPEPQIFGADFSLSKLCHLSYLPDELLEKFEHWKNHNLSLENEDAYQAFLKKFNYPFDGKATDRVLEAISGNEIS